MCAEDFTPFFDADDETVALLEFLVGDGEG
jgi:hypothetical protein